MKRVPNFLQSALPHYDIKTVDLEKDKYEIITEVLNHGTLKQLKWLHKTYSDREIKNVVKDPWRGSWWPKVLNFWTTIFNIKLPWDVKYRAEIRICPTKKDFTDPKIQRMWMEYFEGKRKNTNLK